jgi:hypothetical protein
MIVDEMKVGENYNWINQSERLIYIGFNISGNGYWHQFALVEKPYEVWCETTTSDLVYIEKSNADSLVDYTEGEL